MNDRIRHAVIDGVPSTCIILTGKDVRLPATLLQGKNLTAWLYKDETFSTVSWDGIAYLEDKQCLRFPDLPLFGVEELASRRKGEALTYIRSLASLLIRLSSKDLDLESGIIPLWRIWGVEGGGILLLPEALGSILETCLSETERKASFNDWVHYDLHPPFTLADQMAQMLYWAASGKAPLSDEATREDHCNAMPLSIARTNLAPSVVSFIDSTLHMKLTRQRDLSGNKEPQAFLSWFLEKTTALPWPEAPEVKWESKEADVFRSKQRKRAGKRVFWRKKGVIVLVVVLAFGTVSYIAGSRIKQKLTPPYTLGMSDEMIIEEYYKGQSELDLQKMTASLAPHTKAPAELEVTNMFVARQTREAYENFQAYLNVNDWIAHGKPAIGSQQGLYGVTDITITQVDENTYDVDSTIWTPFPYEDEGTVTIPDKEHTLAFVYQQKQRFVLETNKRGWRLIKEITNLGYEKVRDELVPVVEMQPNPSARAVNAAYSLMTPTN